MTDSFSSRCAVLQGMSTWALSIRGRSNGVSKRNSGPPSSPNRLPPRGTAGAGVVSIDALTGRAAELSAGAALSERNVTVPLRSPSTTS